MEAMSHHAQYEGVSRRITTERKKYVFWKDDDMWLEYLDEYPDYMTQGKTLEKLKENLIDIFNELNKHIIQRQIMAASTLIPLLIRRECLELDRLVDLCINRYHRRDDFAGQGEEDILSDSLAMCIHSFYTGIERIFKAIIREVDGVTSSGPEWHRNLLSAMSVECPGVRPAVISEDTFRSLDDYRAFRHLFRNIYTYRIEPKRIFELIDVLVGTWEMTKRDLEKFLVFLERVE